jgi:hypothetical protein
MVAATEVNDSFNWWYALGIVLTLVLLCLSPYLAYIGKLIFI